MTTQQPELQSPSDPQPQPQPQPQPPYGPAYQQPAPTRRLVRSRDDRMIAGVCGGVADYLGVDVTVVRLLAVAGAILGMGSLVLAYLVAWVIVPRD